MWSKVSYYKLSKSYDYKVSCSLSLYIVCPSLPLSRLSLSLSVTHAHGCLSLNVLAGTYLNTWDLLSFEALNIFIVTPKNKSPTSKHLGSTLANVDIYIYIYIYIYVCVCVCVCVMLPAVLCCGLDWTDGTLLPVTRMIASVRE